MTILHQLSSQTGDRTEYSNRKVVVQCLDDPSLLADIAAGLKHPEIAVVGDCAEVLTHVAQYHPDWIVPFAQDLALLVGHPTTRVRWEAMHALALVAALTPETIGLLLPQITVILRTDKSVIARDYATDALSGYASTSEGAAQAALPILMEMLTLWNGKQAAHGLQGLQHVGRQLPSMHQKLHEIAQQYAMHPRPVIRKAARALQNALDQSPQSERT